MSTTLALVIAISAASAAFGLLATLLVISLRRQRAERRRQTWRPR